MQPLAFIHKDKNRIHFFATLRQRVDCHFKEQGISKHGNLQMKVKSAILLSVYIFSFVSILIFQPGFLMSLIPWTLVGLALAGVGMSVMHDANHGAYSSSSRVNYWMGHSLNLLGGAVYNWKLQHNLLHHTYTNVVHMDDDIGDKLAMRFSPHTEVKWFHRFQFLYAFLLYGILSLYWAMLKDFAQFYKYTKQGVNKGTRKDNIILFVKIVAIKIVYFSIFMVLPLAVLKMPAASYVFGYIFMQFIAGTLLAVVFQLAHTVEETSHPLPNESDTIENTWAIHQLNTTVNFSPKSKWISWYVGGLNFQVEHHLFPTICHVHYPSIAPIVKQTAEEYGIPYLQNETFVQALGSHVRTLQRFGKVPDLNEIVA